MKTLIKIALCQCLLLVALIASAQKNPGHFEKVTIDLGKHDGITTFHPIKRNPILHTHLFASSDYKVVSEKVSSPGASTLEIFFTDVNLGSNSFVKLTSLSNGDFQQFDSLMLEMWNYHTGFFTGDQVLLELFVAPGDLQVGVEINQLYVEDGTGGTSGTTRDDDICDNGDDRVSLFSDPDNASGRVRIPIDANSSTLGTGFITPNGYYMTAGHVCDDANWDDGVLEFNVPLSSAANGGYYTSALIDQYPLQSSPFAFQHVSDTHYSGENDWCVFAVGPNAVDSKLPIDEYRQIGSFDNLFYRITKDKSPSTVRITGFGADNDPHGTDGSGARNEYSSTEQTDYGSFDDEITYDANSVALSYHVKTQPGTSGGAIQKKGEIYDRLYAIGINTALDCGNATAYGTSFEEDDLEDALNDFVPFDYVFVDADHVNSIENGTVLRPYSTIAEGISNSSSGGILDIVEGAYTESVDITERTLKAPVGLVVIGPDASPNRHIQTSDELAPGVTANNPETESLLRAFPNPFESDFKITLTLDEPATISILMHDFLNQQQQVIQNETQYDRGVYSYVINGSKLIPGVYFIEAIVNGKSFGTRVVKVD